MTNLIPTRPYAGADRLSPGNAVLIMTDHQTGLLSACRDYSPETLTNNITALAKVGQVFKLSVVITQGGHGGEAAGGPLLPQFLQTFPDVPVIDRHHPNAYDDPNFQAAVKATGCKKLIVAGCTFDYCCALPAMNLAADGYEVYAVVDASGNWDALITQATMLRLTQAGVTVCNWVAVWGELHRDHNNPEDQALMQAMGEAYPALGWVTNNWMYGKGMAPKPKLVRDPTEQVPAAS